MDPLSALGLASNIIQITEFTGKLISQSKEIYRSADGTLSEHAILEEAARKPARASKYDEAGRAEAMQNSLVFKATK